MTVTPTSTSTTWVSSDATVGQLQAAYASGVSVIVVSTQQGAWPAITTGQFFSILINPNLSPLAGQFPFDNQGGANGYTERAVVKANASGSFTLTQPTIYSHASGETVVLDISSAMLQGMQLPSTGVASVFGRTGAVVAAPGDYSVAQVAGAAGLASPAFTGAPTAPTPSAGDSSTKIATTAFVGTAAGGGVGIYNAAAYGVLPTNSDNVAPLNSLVTTAVNAGIANGTNYAKIIFPNGVYDFVAATTKGSPTFGNAQIPLPVIAPANQKFVLVFEGSKEGASIPHWNQTVGQKAGVVFRTKLTGAQDATNGPACVIGGPTPNQGYGMAVNPNSLFNNMNFVIDGISIVSATVNPTMCGMDMRGMCQTRIGTIGFWCDAATSTVNNTPLTNNWTFALAMPQQNNNDYVNIGSMSIEGWYTGFLMDTEHLVCDRMITIYCQYGISSTSYASDFTHPNLINYWSVEACVYNIGFVGNYAGCVDIRQMDTEDYSSGSSFINVADVYDPGNNGRGYIGINSNHEGTQPVVNGGYGLKIINLSRRPTTMNQTDASPMLNMPASGTAFQNPFWRDCMVYITGTVTAVQINHGGVGNRQVASAAGPFFVPSGATVTLTYTGTPTWIWSMI